MIEHLLHSFVELLCVLVGLFVSLVPSEPVHNDVERSLSAVTPTKRRRWTHKFKEDSSSVRGFVTK